MGMTIKEAIPILHDMYNYYNDVDVDAYVGFDNEDNNAIETALDAMRKYQKIEEVMGLHKEGKILYPRDVVELIRKEIEDRNEDC